MSSKINSTEADAIIRQALRESMAAALAIHDNGIKLSSQPTPGEIQQALRKCKSSMEPVIDSRGKLFAYARTSAGVIFVFTTDSAKRLEAFRSALSWNAIGEV